MIKYALRCGNGHGFEAWFRNSDTFEAQSAAAAIGCPSCADTRVDRAPMAPAIGGRARRGAGARSDDGAGPAPAPAPSDVAPPAPSVDDLRRAVDAATTPIEGLRAMRRLIEATATPVGSNFATEALAMEQGTAPTRAIYGDTTPEERARLDDAGVPVQVIPWVPLDDA